MACEKSSFRNYPDMMDDDNIGQRPNDALFHAETTVLLRAARENGGTLAGRSLEVHSDRPMCYGCERLLPYLGLELGNPTVTFVDPAGQSLTMRNGAWLEPKEHVKKKTYFASRRTLGWPNPKELEPYFLAPPGQRWFFETRNDSGGLRAEGVDGTEHLDTNKGRIDIELEMWGNTDLGV